jgi:hypothetical protein
MQGQKWPCIFPEYCHQQSLTSEVISERRFVGVSSKFVGRVQFSLGHEKNFLKEEFFENLTSLQHFK